MKASLPCSSILILILASGAAQAADKYEGVAIQGTSKDLPSFFQINVTTGGTTSVWGNTSTGQFSVQDKAPSLPVVITFSLLSILQPTER